MEPQDLSRLRIEIARELYAELFIRDQIVQEDVTGVAEVIAAQLWRTFDLRWAPDWDETPAPDIDISLDAATWHAADHPDLRHRI